MDVKIDLIPIEDLLENPKNPRKTFNKHEIIILAENIKEKGLLNPIIVNQSNIVIAGNRRLRAFNYLYEKYGNDYSEIKACRVYTYDDTTISEISLLENLARKDLTQKERNNAILKLRKHYVKFPNKEIEQIANNIKKNYRKEEERRKRLEAATNIYLAKVIGVSKRRIQQIIKNSQEIKNSTSLKVKSPLKITNNRVTIDLNLLEDKLSKEELKSFKEQLGHLLYVFKIE